MGYVDAEWCALDEFICRRILRLRNYRTLPGSHWEDATARECVHKIYCMQLTYLLCRQSALFASAPHNAGFILSSRFLQGR